jgi:hypothetical protein
MLSATGSTTNWGSEVVRIFSVAAATLLILTGIVHSVLGEGRLLKPLLLQRSGILASSLARFILRLAWHLTSLSWLVLAVILLAFQFEPTHAMGIALLTTGVAFSAAGVMDALGSRGRHIGWPLLLAIGIAALLGWVCARSVLI